ncbi:hypothetical protein PIROE2DRAFT_6251 [Piromyces sp. E2]|nr:hypothetical protein PIROE2DRAFT_6251 [Piromyces sp. E2]|eukprot:OUM66523.1 hypothetical protein PIROE2DRAFT_6251 [Piromyces sp. E2]
MAISNDNTMLATSSNDETIRIWNLRTSALISVLKLSLPSRKKDVTHLVFSPTPSPSMNCLLAIADDGIARVWRWNHTTRRYNPEVRYHINSCCIYFYFYEKWINNIVYK